MSFLLLMENCVFLKNTFILVKLVLLYENFEYSFLELTILEENVSNRSLKVYSSLCESLAFQLFSVYSGKKKS